MGRGHRRHRRARPELAAIPGARLVRVPKAGHSSSIEQPDRVNAAITDFLAMLPADQ